MPLQDAKHALEVAHQDGDSEEGNHDCPLKWLSEPLFFASHQNQGIPLAINHFAA